MMTAFFPFLMYTYMRTLFHFYHGSDVGPCDMRIYVGMVFQEWRTGGASFLLRSLLLSNDGWDLGLWALGENTFLYLAFLKQPAIR